MEHVFDGIRVLDFGRHISAPYAALLMANMGADVIKVEKSNLGDDTRVLGPWCNGITLYYPAFNYSKRSIAINFRHEESKKILHDLVTNSDVLIENFRPGTIDQMGISYEACKKINPGIIVLSISGFGQAGPYKDRAAFNDVIESVGMMSFMLPSGIPITTCGGPIADVLTGVYGVSAVTAALHHRKKTGTGQYIDMSMINAATMMRSADVAAVACGVEMERKEAPAGVCRAKDNSYFNFWAGDNDTFERLRKVVCSPVMDDHKYDVLEERMKDEALLLAEVEKFAVTMSAAEAERLLNAADIPCAAVSMEIDAIELVQNEQLNAASWYAPIEVKGLDVFKFHAFPFKMSGCPNPVYKPAVKLGENNDEIFSELLGKTQVEIDTLRNANVIV